jgi:thiol:disulfide interchange protein
VGVNLGMNYGHPTTGFMILLTTVYFVVDFSCHNLLQRMCLMTGVAMIIIYTLLTDDSKAHKRTFTIGCKIVYKVPLPLCVCGGWVEFYLIRRTFQFPALLRWPV